MTFLHPALLWLVPLAAIPILLHLLTLHRIKTVELSTFRFLFDSYVQQRRQIKFLEAILAVLRTLFLLFLVLVVARPVVQHWASLLGAGKERDVIMVVDCSASMNARTAGVTSIERAREAARTITERLGPENRLTLVRLTSRPEIVFSRFTSESEEIFERIDNLSPSSSRSNLYAGLAELFSSTTYRRPGQVVYFFTDCQSGAWREVKEQTLSQVVPADTELVVVNVGSRDPLANRAVIGEPPRESRVVVGLPVMLRPRIANHSKTDRADLSVSVLAGDREVDRVAVGLKPGETVTRDIVYIPSEPGVVRGRFEISGDSFPEDDTFLFTLRVVPAIKVLIVNGSPSKDPLESESLFVLTAMQSQPGGSKSANPVASEPSSSTSTVADLGPGEDFVRSLDVHEIAESALNQHALQDASVVVLANTGNLNAQHFAWLRDFVAGSGGLLVFPGDKVNPDTYSKQFFAAPAAGRGTRPNPKRSGRIASPLDPLVELKIAPAVGDLEKSDEFEKLAAIDFAHPVLNVFEDPQSRYLSGARFFRRYKLELDADRSSTWPLAHFSGGDAAIVESRFGQGIVLVTAFPSSAKWSNLPLRPEFVPLVLRMASYVMRRTDVESPSVVPPGGTAEFSVNADWSPARAKVIDPAGRIETASLERAEGVLGGAFENTAEKGYYAVEISGGPAEQPKHQTVAFAVNLAPDESDFNMITEDDLKQWLPGINARLVDASAQSQQLHGELGTEREIWRPLIVLLFIIIAIEFMLSTMGGLRERESLTVAQRLRQMSPSTWVGQMTGADHDRDNKVQP